PLDRLHLRLPLDALARTLGDSALRRNRIRERTSPKNRRRKGSRRPEETASESGLLRRTGSERVLGAPKNPIRAGAQAPRAAGPRDARRHSSAPAVNENSTVAALSCSPAWSMRPWGSASPAGPGRGRTDSQDRMDHRTGGPWGPM